jgi:hypothetical protein
LPSFSMTLPLRTELAITETTGNLVFSSAL